MSKHLIRVVIPTEWELQYPNEVREFLDRFEVIRRVVPPDMDATIYQLQNPRFPGTEDFYSIITINPKIAIGDYMKVIYI